LKLFNSIKKLLKKTKRFFLKKKKKSIKLVFPPDTKVLLNGEEFGFTNLSLVDFEPKTNKYTNMKKYPLDCRMEFKLKTIDNIPTAAGFIPYKVIDECDDLEDFVEEMRRDAEETVRKIMEKNVERIFGNDTDEIMSVGKVNFEEVKA
jgi:hypothetical protein